MILSFCAYIVSFLIFGLSASVPLLFVAMLLFAVGESFREGTHKAMIFTWLRIHGRLDERTRVYGFTRSWSQIGSAVSVVLAALFVIAGDGYAEDVNDPLIELTDARHLLVRVLIVWLAVSSLLVLGGLV